MITNRRHWQRRKTVGFIQVSEIMSCKQYKNIIYTIIFAPGLMDLDGTRHICRNTAKRWDLYEKFEIFDFTQKKPRSIIFKNKKIRTKFSIFYLRVQNLGHIFNICLQLILSLTLLQVILAITIIKADSTLLTD